MLRDAPQPRAVKRPAGGSVLRVEIGIEKGDEYPLYLVEITNRAGVLVWRADRLKATASGAGSIVRTDMSADRLAAGRYRVRLVGLRGSDAEDLAVYEFSITR